MKTQRLTASASPPAKLALLVELGVSRPLLPPPFVPFTDVKLTPLSLGAGGGAGLRAPGLFAGGAGGAGLGLIPTAGTAAEVEVTESRAVLLARNPSEAALDGIGTTRAAPGAGPGGGAGGAGLATSSLRYADGVQACIVEFGFVASHQP